MLTQHLLYKNTAYSLRYMGQPVPKALTFKGVTLSIHTEIESCRIENNICLVGGLREDLDLT